MVCYPSYAIYTLNELVVVCWGPGFTMVKVGLTSYDGITRIRFYGYNLSFGPLTGGFGTPSFYFSAAKIRPFFLFCKFFSIFFGKKFAECEIVCIFVPFYRVWTAVCSRLVVLFIHCANCFKNLPSL